MSGDAQGTKGIFTMTGGTYTWPSSTGPAFYVTNSTGVITLKNVAVSNSSGTLIKAGADQWGTSGSNGGTVIFTADAETLTGDLVCDNISSITATLQNGTTFTGMIDSAALIFDATSSWVVTATSYLTSLTDAGGISGTSISNITGNGHTVYYNAGLAANSTLGGKTFALVNGGVLTPKGTTGVEESQIATPSTWMLQQNYPNPFNPTTTIRYGISQHSTVSLSVYTVLGQRVAILVNGIQEAGYHEATFDGTRLPSGVYIYRLQSGSYMETKRLVLLK
jgi:hypothetical protein